MKLFNTPNGDLGILDKTLDGIGGVVDEAFLTLPRLFKPFKPKRKVDRKSYEAEVDFYFEHHFVDQPETFFRLDQALPDYSVVSETLFEDDGVRREITFTSHYAPRNPLVSERFFLFTENKTARLIQWAHGDSGRKTLVCLHGYMLGDPDQAEKMFKVKTLFQMGLDVVLFITPFHWKRSPADKMLRGMFLQPDDVVMTCECFGQTMHDLAQSILVLKHMGADETGLIGASLGGYNAALFACLSDQIRFAALMVPAIKFTGDFSPQPATLPFYVDKPFLDRLNRLWTLHSPLNFNPKISKNRILVIASRGDRLCPFVHVHDLCEQWGWPKHVFMTGGHWLVANARERGRAWYRFLAEMGFIDRK